MSAYWARPAWSLVSFWGAEKLCPTLSKRDSPLPLIPHHRPTLGQAQPAHGPAPSPAAPSGGSSRDQGDSGVPLESSKQNNLVMCLEPLVHQKRSTVGPLGSGGGHPGLEELQFLLPGPGTLFQEDPRSHLDGATDLPSLDSCCGQAESPQIPCLFQNPHSATVALYSTP